MFGFARFIVHHKIGAVAVIALGVVIFTPDKDDEAANANSPWAAQSGPVLAAAEEEGILDKVVDKADTMLAESGMDPRVAADETVGRFDDTAERYSAANSN